MSLYRLKVKIFARRKGHRVDGARAYRRGASAPAAAAYRRGEKQQKVPGDDRKPRSYSKKKGIAYTTILVPVGAPDWASDSAKLWLEVERKERRRDAQLAREILITLPRDIPLDDSLPELLDWTDTNVVARGMIADISVHSYGTALDPTKKIQADMIQEIRESGIPIYPLQPGDLLRCMPPDHHHAWEYPDGRLLVYQPHAHIMVTMRSISGDGFGLKQREWNSPVLLNDWRESWEHSYNKLLAAVGSTDRVSSKAKKKAHREVLATAGLSSDSPEAPLEPLRQFSLNGGVYAYRDGRPPRNDSGDLSMRPSIVNERIRLVAKHEAKIAETIQASREEANRWQNAWEKTQEEVFAQRLRTQDAEREKRLSEMKLEEERTARHELERGVEAVTALFAEPLGAAAPKKGTILERLRSTAGGVADFLRQETARADEAEEEVGFLRRHLRGILKWAQDKLPSERGELEKAEVRILGRTKVRRHNADTEQVPSLKADVATPASPRQVATAPSPTADKPKKHFSTERYRRKSAAFSPLLLTPPKDQAARRDGKVVSTGQPRPVPPMPTRKRNDDEHQL